ENHRRELELKVKERTAQLEQEKTKAAEAQEALIRTTRLASLGELAGVAAHEVLNPVNNINVRLERIRAELTGAQKEDIGLLGEIVSGWEKTYREKGWSGLQEDLHREANDGRALIEEDLDNLRGIQRDLLARLETRKQDFEFLSGEITRITKIVNNMRSLARVKG